jgi:hypothetical protein
MNALLPIAGALALVGLGIGLYGLSRYRTEPRRIKELEAKVADAEEAARADGGVAHEVGFEAPKLEGGLSGLLLSWRERAKAKRMARKGYVRWHLIDGNNVRPTRWVKPEKQGHGIREYSKDDTDYLFPDDALVVDSQTGARVAYHHVGEPEPINLREPGYATLSGDEMEKLLDQQAEDSPASWLADFDFDAQTIMYLMIGGVLLFAAIMQFTGGG